MVELNVAQVPASLGDVVGANHPQEEGADNVAEVQRGGLAGSHVLHSDEIQCPRRHLST